MLVGHAPLGEVPQRAGGEAAGAAGRQRSGVGENTCPQGRGRREAIGERAALMDGGPVGAEEVLVVVEERPQASSVSRHQPLVGARSGDTGPEHRIQVQGPGVVVVELAAVAVGVPAVAPVPVLQACQPGVYLAAAVRGADGGEELLGDDLEQPPVGIVDDRSDEAAQPVGDPLPYAVVEPVPDPGARLVQGDRE